MTRIRLITLTLAVLLHLACTVDKPCTVTMENAPELRGFRLGMSLSDIQKRFPNFPASNISANQFGVATVDMSAVYRDNNFGTPLGHNIISLYYISSFPELSGLKHVELKLLDGRLIEVTVFYPNDIKWQSVDEFVQKTSEALKLNGSWHKIGTDGTYSESRLLQCGWNEPDGMFMVHAGFKKPPADGVSVADFKLPYVGLEDFMHGEMEIFTRQKASDEKAKQDEEQRKQTFRP
jgi:hypothetical protein